tara:strand:+ start:1086 stop:1280 length:195 start_codon:yes stop_codon:yes gene_type:complete
MKKLLIFLLLLTGCSILFNPEKYNPNPTPIVEETCCDKDSIRIDTIRLTNGIDHIIMLDTVRIK